MKVGSIREKELFCYIALFDLAKINQFGTQANVA